MGMRCTWLKDAGDTAIVHAVETAADTKGFVQCRRRSIKGPGKRSRNDDSIGLDQCGVNISFLHPVAKQSEKAVVGRAAFGLIKAVESSVGPGGLQQGLVFTEKAEGDHTCRLAYLGEVCLQIGRGDGRRAGESIFFPIGNEDPADLVETVAIGQILIIGYLMMDIQKNDHAACQSDRKACDIDEGKKLVLHQAAPRNDPVIPEHYPMYEKSLIRVDPI